MKDYIKPSIKVTDIDLEAPLLGASKSPEALDAHEYEPELEQL